MNHPHDIFKDIQFDWVNSGPNTITYTVLATGHNGVGYTASVNISKSVSVDQIKLRDSLINNLLVHITKLMITHAEDSWNEFILGIKSKDDEHKKLQTKAPLVNGTIGQFGEIQHHVNEHQYNIKGHQFTSIFDNKKNPKFTKAEEQYLASKDMIDLITKTANAEFLKIAKGTKTGSFSSPAPLNVMETALNKFPALGAIIKRCPAKCKHHTDTTIANFIVHLNDIHKWPREKIADWLDTLDVDLSVPIPKEDANATH